MGWIHLKVRQINCKGLIAKASCSQLNVRPPCFTFNFNLNPHTGTRPPPMSYRTLRQVSHWHTHSHVPQDIGKCHIGTHNHPVTSVTSTQNHCVTSVTFLSHWDTQPFCWLLRHIVLTFDSNQHLWQFKSFMFRWCSNLLPTSHFERTSCGLLSSGPCFRRFFQILLGAF